MKDEIASLQTPWGIQVKSPAWSLAGCQHFGKKLVFESSENPRGPAFIGKPILPISEPMFRLPSAENTFGSYRE